MTKQSLPPYSIYYGDPLDEASIDPEILSLIHEVNASGRLWTTSSCAGHLNGYHPNPLGELGRFITEDRVSWFPYLGLIVAAQDVATVCRQVAISGKEINIGRLQPKFVIAEPEIDPNWLVFYVAFPHNSRVELASARERLTTFCRSTIEAIKAIKSSRPEEEGMSHDAG